MNSARTRTVTVAWVAAAALAALLCVGSAGAAPDEVEVIYMVAYAHNADGERPIYCRPK